MDRSRPMAPKRNGNPPNTHAEDMVGNPQGAAEGHITNLALLKQVDKPSRLKAAAKTILEIVEGAKDREDIHPFVVDVADLIAGIWRSDKASVSGVRPIIVKLEEASKAIQSLTKVPRNKFLKSNTIRNPDTSTKALEDLKKSLGDVRSTFELLSKTTTITEQLKAVVKPKTPSKAQGRQEPTVQPADKNKMRDSTAEKAQMDGNLGNNHSKQEEGSRTGRVQQRTVEGGSDAGHVDVGETKVEHVSQTQAAEQVAAPTVQEHPILPSVALARMLSQFTLAQANESPKQPQPQPSMEGQVTSTFETPLQHSPATPSAIPRSSQSLPANEESAPLQHGYPIGPSVAQQHSALAGQFPLQGGNPMHPFPSHIMPFPHNLYPRPQGTAILRMGDRNVIRGAVNIKDNGNRHFGGQT
ncbi:hypothetical protein BDZ97DRAFT_1842484 [Flammula alnicola]|nr:hypothetical protein BDZ97DRAFT_1842484 [Flammula alnicola]